MLWSITRLFTELPMRFSLLDNQCMQDRKCGGLDYQESSPWQSFPNTWCPLAVIFKIFIRRTFIFPLTPSFLSFISGWYGHRTYKKEQVPLGPGAFFYEYPVFIPRAWGSLTIVTLSFHFSPTLCNFHLQSHLVDDSDAATCLLCIQCEEQDDGIASLETKS